MSSKTDLQPRKSYQNYQKNQLHIYVSNTVLICSDPPPPLCTANMDYGKVYTVYTDSLMNTSLI